MAVQMGRQLGNYQLIRLLGEGGFAEVYLAEHIYLGTKAAIKLMRGQLESQEMESFRLEARTVANLAHPNIVRVLEFGVEDKTPYLVLDYAANGSLRQRYPKGNRLPLTTIVPYIVQVAEALQCAHDQNIVHRDVKPENMLLGRSSQVLLSDFGLAVMSQGTNMANLQQTAGTLAYIAPEQAQGKPRYASDQYSLGIVVYEWLSGTRPFQGSFSEIISQHLTTPPPPLREKVPALSADVERVVMRALAKDPKERFSSVREFATTLAQVAQFEDATIVVRSTASAESPTPVLPLPLTDDLPTIAPGTDAPQDAPAVVPAAPVTPKPSTQPRSSTSSGPVSRTPALYTYHEHTGRVNVVAWSPDGKSFASGSDDKTILLWDALTGNKLGSYTGHAGSVQTLMWSPDGKRIASGGTDKTVQVWDATTRTIQVTYRGHTGAIKALAWSPDGEKIVSVSNDEAHVWDTVQASNLFVYRGHLYGIHAVAWSPDGKRIASGGSGKAVQVWDALDGRNILPYRGHAQAVNTLAWSPDNRQIASGSEDKTLHIWEVVTGWSAQSPRSHAAPVTTLSWSTDGTRIASASTDGIVQVWDAETGVRVSNHRHTSPLRTVAWSPDGVRLAFAGDDGSVLVWSV